MRLLLCVDDSGLHARSPLKAGTTYTFELDPTCACCAGDRLVCVSECRWTREGFVQKCRACGSPLRNRGFIAYLERRFIPLNDPDTRSVDEPARRREPLETIAEILELAHAELAADNDAATRRKAP